MVEKIMGKMKGELFKESLATNIKKWAGIDVQILHRFELQPYIDSSDDILYIVVWDYYQEAYLQIKGGKPRCFDSSYEALEYLRSCYEAKDEEYEIIVKKKKRGDLDGDSGTEV